MQKADIQRFEWFKAQVDRLGIRFPIAEIAEKTGFDQGNISSYLKGKKPLSDNFLTRFKEAYRLDEEGRGDEATTRDILKVMAEAFKAQTEIIKSIENKMAREDTQADMKTNLDEVRSIVDKLSKGQNKGVELLLKEFAKIHAAQGRTTVKDKRKIGNGEGE